MKIALFTNTFTPHVGGVANSVTTLIDGMRRRGHRCLVIAPEFSGQPEDEEDVVRVAAIKNFNGTDFSFKLPGGTLISETIERFKPDLIHSHHPFLLGDAALRMAQEWDVPLVFTHHTRYENYVHYVLEESEWLEQLAIELATAYANLCDTVIAPSGSIASLIKDRGVTVPVEVIPTGIDYNRFSKGDGGRARKRLGIPEAAFLVGHVGRLAEEKNLGFLMESVCRFLAENQETRFLVAGSGDYADQLRQSAKEAGLAERVHFAGQQKGQDLVDLYHALDVFVFSSKSETQGMVLAEAMAAGVPVVALEASGVRDILRDGENGRMLPADASPDAFAGAIHEVEERLDEKPDTFSESIRETAVAFSAKVCLDRLECVYTELVEQESGSRDLNSWSRFMHRMEAEWELAQSRARAVSAAFKKTRKESGES